jgi:outer membrane lipoprotein-sorting protein
MTNNNMKGCQMKKHLLTGLSMAAVIVICVAIPCLSQSQAAAPAAAPTATEIFNSLLKQSDALTQYHLLFEYNVMGVGKSKKESRVCEFWYIEPDMRRLDVIDGDDKGNKVIYNGKQNKKAVRAKQPFLPVPISVDRKDPRLAGFFSSDWKADVGEIKGFTAGATPELVGGSKVKDREAWKIEFKNLKGEYDRVVLWVDKKDKVLLQYEYYTGKDLFSRKTWYDYTLDAKLKPADFKF